jgi:ABC-type polar amino acid transport system ATPase subunit
MINTIGLSVNSFEKKLLLDNISCVVPAGRITLLIGKSGAGKTTLLKTIAKLQEGYEGTIIIDGHDISQLNNAKQVEYCGYVFQDFNLFENLTVLENCTQPLMVVKGYDEETSKNIAMQYLTDLGIETILDCYPKKLSGGQKQRVAIARALCMGSKTLLLDEPTSALDPENTAKLITVLKNLCSKGIALLISSQDINFLKLIADHIYLMEDGKIIETFDATASDTLPPSSLIYTFLNY